MNFSADPRIIIYNESYCLKKKMFQNSIQEFEER